MNFKLWSQTNKEALKNLKPDLGLRPWDDLTPDDKYKIWKFLQEYFFNKDAQQDHYQRDADDHGNYYEFYGEPPEQEAKRKRVFASIWNLNDLYKAQGYANKFLEHGNLTNACADFYSIFIKQKGDAVLELLSLYCKVAAKERLENYYGSKDPSESQEKYDERKEGWKWQPFDEFAESLNDVFSHFGLNVYLTRLGFVPRQEEKITEEVYNPVIAILSNSKWKEVNQLLIDAFNDYKENTPTGYSSCVTNVVSAVQAFLQIIVNGKTGSSDISKLIPQAQSKGLIPSDLFSKEIFKNIESILMRERQETGISHPKEQYANEKNARMVLNLSMVFLQHCIQQ